MPISAGVMVYGASIIAIHAADGSMAWYYQTTLGDRWDYDSTQKMILADVGIGGRTRQVLMQASKNRPGVAAQVAAQGDAARTIAVSDVKFERSSN